MGMVTRSGDDIDSDDECARLVMFCVGLYPNPPGPGARDETKDVSSRKEEKEGWSVE